MFGFGQLIEILKKDPKKIVFTEEGFLPESDYRLSPWLILLSKYAISLEVGKHRQK